MRGLRALVVSLFVVFLTALPALAQTGSVSGRVTDPQGGVVIGAAVTLTPVAGKMRTTRTL